ncbi:hypothetical protein PoB_003546000 [Plakobranchus ocellatus]|uniref:Uncharacterized protein n=1 Tax=Plakobranchus ocellatus TaxID=259542 RepID=A0AAV4AQ06_9GAST|nr:hypothetical protein PoB_003546000 [Plakobranchus ocellatus]
MGFCIKPVHNKVISGFKALRQAGAPMAGLEPATEGSLQISQAPRNGSNNIFIRLTENRYEWRNMIANVCFRQGYLKKKIPFALKDVPVLMAND